MAQLTTSDARYRVANIRVPPSECLNQQKHIHGGRLNAKLCVAALSSILVCTFDTAEFGAEEALERMRHGIPPSNVASGGQNTEDSGSHETLTCFWADIIRDFIAASQFPTTFAAVQPRGLFDATVLQYGQQRKLHEEYYSFDVVADRREWDSASD